MTYTEAYLAALYDILERGGRQEIVDKAIAEVNNPSDDGLQLWLKTHPTQPCDQCGIPFKPENVTLAQEMSCPSCKSSKA